MATRWQKPIGGIDEEFKAILSGCLPRGAGDMASHVRWAAARLEARHGDALAKTHRRH